MGEQTGAAGLHDPRLHVGGVSLARREGRLGRSDSSSPASALAIHLWAVESSPFVTSCVNNLLAHDS